MRRIYRGTSPKPRCASPAATDRIVDAVVSSLGRGLTLSVTHRSAQSSFWRLSNGAPVSAEVALRVIADPRVAGDRDALFADCLAQTYRHVSDDEEAPRHSKTF
jgi:hypothetical protein